MPALKNRKYLALAAPTVLAGLTLLFGCVGSEDRVSDETEAAYALRAEVSGSTDSKKTYVCHIPPGNPANAHTIHVGNSAVDAHLDHGDSLGQCDSVLVPADTGKNCKGKGKGLGKRKSIQDIVKKDGQGWKVTICHLPPGNPENAQSLTIGAAAVRAHLDHGDILGACVIVDDTATEQSVSDCPDTGSDTGTTGGGSDTGTTGPGTGTGGSDTTPVDNT